MSRYRAVLSGDRLQWKGDAPSITTPVDVEVEIPDQVEQLSPEERRCRREEALAGLASINAFSAIEDPVEWQREIRKDRPLSGREE